MAVMIGAWTLLELTSWYRIPVVVVSAIATFEALEHFALELFRLRHFVIVSFLDVVSKTTLEFF